MRFLTLFDLTEPCHFEVMREVSGSYWDSSLPAGRAVLNLAVGEHSALKNHECKSMEVYMGRLIAKLNRL